MRENVVKVLSHEESLPTIFASRDAHMQEEKFKEKINSLLDQLGHISKGKCVCGWAVCLSVWTVLRVIG